MATCLVVRLAVARTWVQREELLALLWPDRAEVAARTSLRQLLRALPADLAEQVERERQALRYAGPTDVADAHLHALASDWPAVLALHRGPLLDGFRLRRAPAFEDWLEEARATFTHAFHDAAQRAFDAALVAGAAPAAVDVAGRWLERDPTDRVVALTAAAGLVRVGRASDALRALRRHADAVTALGLEIDDEVTDRIEALRTLPARSLGTRAADRPEVAARRPRADLAGRGADLDALDAWWAGLGRWLTIVAPGGMGKSVLAAAWSRSLEPAATEVDTVDLDGVTAPADAARRAVQAIARGGAAGGTGAAAFARLVGGRPHLLVLDGAESLGDAAATLRAWCDAAPGLRLLVTSRRVLGGVGERVHSLGALAVVPGPGGTASAAAQAAWQAARAAADDTGGPDEPPRVVQRHVARQGGWPLGLKLLGGWAAWLGLDGWLAALEGDALDLPGDDGVRVVEASWAHLDELGRTAMARLAALPRPWTLDDARDVGVAPATLRELVATGWVSAGAGAFTIHLLLAEHARRHDPDAAAVARARHADRVLATFEEAFDRSGRPPPYAHRRVDHLIDAWSWACEAGDAGRLERAQPVVFAALSDARLVDATRACVERAAAVAAAGSRLRRRLDVVLMGATWESRERAVGLALADRLDAEAATADDGFVRACVAWYRGAVAYADRRDFEAAVALATAGLAFVDGAGDRRSLAAAAQLANLVGVAEGARGHHAAAEAWISRATELGHAAGGPSVAAGWSHNLVLEYLARGRFAAALALADHNVAAGERDGSRIARAERWHVRGIALAMLGDLAGARRSFERAIAVSEPMHAAIRGHWQRLARLHLALVAAREGAYEEARRLVEAHEADAFVASVHARVALAANDVSDAARWVELGLGHLEREGGPASDRRLHALLATLRADVALREGAPDARDAVLAALDAALATGLDPTIAEAAAVALGWLRAARRHDLAERVAAALADTASAPAAGRASAREDLERHPAVGAGRTGGATAGGAARRTSRASAGGAPLAALAAEALATGRGGEATATAGGAPPSGAEPGEGAAAACARRPGVS